jgi:hypothetical protein
MEPCPTPRPSDPTRRAPPAPRARARTAGLAIAATATVMGFSLGAGLGCAPEFTPGSVITHERILAVIADPPEAVPGQLVRYTPVVVAPTGTLAEGDGYSAVWWRCPESDSDGLSDAPVCRRPADRTDFATGAPLEDTIPEDLFGLPATPPEEPPPELPDDKESLGTPKLLGALLGYWRITGLSILAPGSATSRRDAERVVDGFKRVPVYLPVPLGVVDERLADLDVRLNHAGVIEPNTNPLLSAVTVHEGAVNGPTVQSLKAGGTYFFVPRLDDRSLQDHSSLQVNLAGLPLDDPEALAGVGVEELLARFRRVGRCEIPTYTWYVSAGRVRREVTVDEGAIARVFDPRGVPCPALEGDLRTADTEYTAPAGDDGDPLPGDGTVHVWVVARDGRGGTAVRELSLPVSR